MELGNLLEPVQGYRCKECNFISTSEAKVKDHILQSHEHLLSKEIESSADVAEETEEVEKPWGDLFKLVPSANKVIFNELDHESFLALRKVCWAWRVAVNQFRPKWEQIRALTEPNLEKALSRGEKYLAEVLILKLLKINVRGRQSALHMAATNYDCTKMLINNGADVNYQVDKQPWSSLGKTPLHIAVNSEEIKVAEILLKNGAQVNCSDGSQRTPLHIAARRRHPVHGERSRENNRDMIELLLQYGADTDARDELRRTPLFCAVEDSTTEVLELLINSGADVNALGEWDEMGRSMSPDACYEKNRNNYNVTPLHLAAGGDYMFHPSVASVECLIQHGALIEAIDGYGLTPLHSACIKGNVDEKTLEMLIKAGANVNVKDNFSRTPLHLVCHKYGWQQESDYMGNRIAKLKALISAGADVNVPDGNGRTPLDIAFDKKLEEMLISHGARRSSRVRSSSDWWD